MGISGLGGFLVVPLMIVVADATPSQAVFTALAANLGVTLFNGLFAIGRGQVDWRVLRLMMAGSAVGALAGAWLLSTLPSEVARYVIALCLAGLGIASLVPKRAGNGSRERPLPAPAAVLLGLGAQVSAVLVGIGGPAITVPVMAAGSPRADRVVGTALLHGALVSGLGLFVTRLAGASFSWLVVTIGALIVVSSLAASTYRSRLLATVSLRPVVGVLALVGAGVLLLLR